MNRPRTLITAGLLALSMPAGAQSANLFNTSETLNAGNISAPHLVHGDMWWNPASGTSPMQFPKGASNQLNGFSAIWMGGRDVQGQLKVAAQAYRKTGADLWPGPIGSSASSYNSAHTQAWARIWKINSATIDAFLQTSPHTVANTPAEILEWPGRGNGYAKGANGVSVTANDEMAPFVDLNSNSIYEPLAGEYPRMKGSQMLWWVLNDNAVHDISQTNTIGLEVRVSAYSYAKGTPADNIIFYEYDLVNNSPNTMMDFVFATFADLDVSNPFNDQLGFDSVKRLAVIYEQDGADRSSRRAAGSYVLLDQPGDAWTQYGPVGAMTYFHNEPASANSDPTNGLEFYRYMTGYNRAGSEIRPGSRYALESLEAACAANKYGHDQRFVLATRPVAFPSLQRLHFSYAFVAADSVGYCNDMDFSGLLATADTAYKLYWNPTRITPPNPTSVPGTVAAQVDVYPNPASEILHVAAKLRPDAQLSVINAVGASIAVPLSRTAVGYDLDIRTLPPGLYHLRISDWSIQESRTFIKK